MRITALLILVYVVMCRMNSVVYSYHRTLKQVAQEFGIPMKEMWVLIPQRYYTMQHIAVFRWIVLSALIYFSWFSALICFVLFNLWDYFSPKRDDLKHLKRALNELENYRLSISSDFYLMLRRALLSVMRDLQ